MRAIVAPRAKVAVRILDTLVTSFMLVGPDMDRYDRRRRPTP
jgi:hypothetical protein